MSEQLKEWWASWEETSRKVRAEMARGPFGTQTPPEETEEQKVLEADQPEREPPTRSTKGD